MKLRKIIGIIGGPSIGTLIIGLFFIISQLLFPNEHVQGTDEVAAAFFYFILLPVFLVLGVIIQIFLVTIVYNSWDNKTPVLLRKYITLLSKLTISSTLLTTFPFIADPEILLNSFLVILLLYVFYYGISQTFYLFVVKVFPLKRDHLD